MRSWVPRRKHSAVSRQPSAYFIQKLFGVACAMGINCSGSVATGLWLIAVRVREASALPKAWPKAFS
ncbi:hypothetical protein BJP36_43730 [Moorena producens JHB]|uniref:Uncharacterized protein n=1 Tax=Moorena producens (strain JHB) TaxID=1454205 RepID=A0A9Q9UVX3_MOOP1|nr:hypothetical protein [Moorena producens]WAN69274.1 hypothetical protein BJP36_43730 [Moorena producens JHB]